jgi:hypothetical protein
MRVLSARGRRPVIAASPAAAIAIAAEFRVSLVPVLRGVTYAPAQGRSVSRDRIDAPNKWARSLDVHAAGSSERDIGQR